MKVSSKFVAVADKVKVVPYDSCWPEQFALVAALLRRHLGSKLLEVHHVGSTSVPELCAKPKLDIIAVVNDSRALQIEGFEYRGEFNIPLHRGYRMHTPFDVNLHVYEEGDPEIELNLTFRNYLRKHSHVRGAYAALKQQLLQDSSSSQKHNSMFTGYNLGKDAFIRKVLDEAGFSRLRMVRCVHHIERAAVQPFQPNFDRDEHFVLCLGTEVVGYAHIEENKIWLLTILKEHRNQGYAQQFLAWIERWLQRGGHTVARAASCPFLERCGFKPSTGGDLVKPLSAQSEQGRT